MNNVVINQVLILFVIMIIGFLARRKEVLTPTVSKGLTDLLLNVTCPLTIFTSFQFTYSRSMLVSAAQVFAFAVAIHLLSVLLGIVLFKRYPEQLKKVLSFVTIFSNCGFMGFPLLQSIYGKIGVFYGSFYVLVFNLFIWTVGIRIFSGQQNRSALKKVISNPNIIAVGLGLATFLLQIKLPGPVFTAMESVGAMNTPLSMLLVGAILTEVKPRELFSGFAVYYGTFMRLVFMPFVALIITGLLNFSPLLQGVCVLITATPAASLTTAFTEKYNGDSPFASRLILLSTLFSMLTLPFFVFLLNR